MSPYFCLLLHFFYFLQIHIRIGLMQLPQSLSTSTLAAPFVPWSPCRPWLLRWNCHLSIPVSRTIPPFGLRSSAFKGTGLGIPQLFPLPLLFPQTPLLSAYVYARAHRHTDTRTHTHTSLSLQLRQSWWVTPSPQEGFILRLSVYLALYFL